MVEGRIKGSIRATGRVSPHNVMLDQDAACANIDGRKIDSRRWALLPAGAGARASDETLMAIGRKHMPARRRWR